MSNDENNMIDQLYVWLQDKTGLNDKQGQLVLDALTAVTTERDQLKGQVAALENRCSTRAIEIARLQSCEVDARRYRWLRGQSPMDDIIVCGLLNPEDETETPLAGPELDAVLDARIAQSQPQPLGGSDNG